MVLVEGRQGLQVPLLLSTPQALRALPGRKLLMGKLRPREEAMNVVLRDIHCESMAEAGLELRSSPDFQSRAFDATSYSRGKVDRKMGFYPLVSLSSGLFFSAGSFSSPHRFPGRAYPVL